MEEAHKGLGEVDERRRRVHVDGSKLRKERKKMVKHRGKCLLQPKQSRSCVILPELLNRAEYNPNCIFI